MARDKLVPGAVDTMLVKDIPSVVKSRFKAWCALYGMDMRAVVIDFMRNIVESPPDVAKIRRLNRGKITALPEEENAAK